MNKFTCFTFLLFFIIFTAFTNGEHHPCSRNCSNTEPMTCYYDWILESYRSMSKACYDCPYNVTDCSRKDCIAGDGTEVILNTVNREMPGPYIQICLNDTIVVKVKNNIEGSASTIHWHGIDQQETPYMDGTPMVTQCPINLFETFVYQFTPKEYGTFWWHSHVACQRDGIFGPLIIRIPKELDPHGQLYDHDEPEHTILLQNWHNRSCHEEYSGSVHSTVHQDVSTFLINGKGRKDPFQRDNEIYYPPLARFVVKQGHRYRFRIISNILYNCPTEVSIENHNITLISTDGNDFKPIDANSFLIYSGERWDFVLVADKPVGLYWIKFRGVNICSINELGSRSYQVAVLQYEGASDTDLPTGTVSYDTATVDGIQVNELEREEANKTFVPLIDLVSLDDDDDLLKEIPDIKMYTLIDYYPVDNDNFHNEDHYGYNDVDPDKRSLTPQIDHISMENPPFPLLSQRESISDGMTCNNSLNSVKDCNSKFCQCPHVEMVPLNAVVEMVIVDSGSYYPTADHPFHLHGYRFRVIGMDYLWPNITLDEVRKLDGAGKLTRVLSKAPLKDTTATIVKGVTILRFKASNPGFWLFHCHIEIHAEKGMAFVFKVGENSDMVEVPYGFPTCGNYDPTST